ncbi:DNA_replication licensing factor MCM3 [Hexamita inflata]|uniref:DNA helicase n=1 Tax=Hexamita inflata TaxID=28002 RepID=A0AA86V414_9EUKA|nr:DNA replication licensing factor MCM3 [Hexamita inflata]
MDEQIAQARAQIAELDRRIRFKKLHNEQSNTVEITFEQIIDFSQDLYNKLTENPLVYLSTLQNYLSETITQSPQLILSGDPIGSRVAIPRDLSAEQMCQMFKVIGIATKTQPPQPSLQKLVVYDPTTKTHSDKKYDDPYTTLNPQALQQFIPRQIDQQERVYPLSSFISEQRIIIQDCPEHVPQGRIPRSIQVIFTRNLVDQAKAGDRVEVVGCLLPTPNYGPAEAKTQTVRVFFLAFSVKVVQRTRILKQVIPTNEFNSFLTQLQNCGVPGMSTSIPALELLAASISPSIYGHTLIKKAIVLQLLSGVKRVVNSTRIRGDINILLIGAPGCGKSQLLRAALNLSPIAMSASGRGASGAGLTAAVIIDNNTGNRTLEAGAFVLADGGVLAIDEFDKLQAYDRVAIHEAMEQQTVSISKAGIHATLNARCSVLAAANFIYGGFDFEKTIAENINLPDSLLSRFDLIFIVQDDQDYDAQISKHVVQNHMKSEPYVNQNQLQAPVEQVKTSQTNTAKNAPSGMFADLPVTHFLVNQPQHQQLLDAFKKYTTQQVSPQRFLLQNFFLNNLLQYCKHQSEDAPFLSKEAVLAVAEFYAKLRKHEARGLLVTARALEAMIRLSTALAKLSYPIRDVTREDVIEAYVLVRHSLFGESENEIRRTVSDKHKPKQQKDNFRYDLFIQAFGDIIEEIGENSIDVKDLKKLMNKWFDDKTQLGEKHFTTEEFDQFVAQMAKTVNGMALQNGVIYI